MPGILDGKVALITGGTSGIGRATAIKMAEAGAKIVFTGRRTLEGRAVEAEIAAAGGQAIYIPADVAKAADADAMVQAAVENFGRLDIAFNNAGLTAPPKLLVDDTEEDFDYVMAPNVRGMWLSLRAEVRQMLKQGGGGVIVNNSSIYGKKGVAMSAHYVASKHAVEGYTKSYAIEVATAGIRINAVAPGYVKTRLTHFPENPEAERYMVASHAMPRMGEDWEVADAVIFLASPAASFITGAILPVDGGCLAK